MPSFTIAAGWTMAAVLWTWCLIVAATLLTR